MTPDEAAWVRENVWSKTMRKSHRHELDRDRTRPIPISYRCETGQHDTCHLGVPLPFCETYITNRLQQVLTFDEPFRHPKPSATGWHYEHNAMVWLADRRCAWSCPCDCGHPLEVPHAPEKNPGPRPAERQAIRTSVPVPVRFEVVALPGLEDLPLY